MSAHDSAIYARRWKTLAVLADVKAGLYGGEDRGGRQCGREHAQEERGEGAA